MSAIKQFQIAFERFLDFVDLQSDIFSQEGQPLMFVDESGGACFHARRLLQICEYQAELPPDDFGYIDIAYFLRCFALDCERDVVASLWAKWTMLVSSGANWRRQS